MAAPAFRENKPLKSGIVHVLRLVVVIIVVLGVSAVAVQNIQEWALASPLLRAAERLEQEAKLGQASATASKMALDVPDIQQATSSCFGKAARAQVTLALARVNAAQARTDVQALDVARFAAIQSIRERLSCVPADGNAWLQLALIVLVQEGPTALVKQALANSYRHAPYEEWIMTVRLPVIADLAFRAGLDFGDMARMEFAAFMTLGQQIERPMSVLALFPKELGPTLLGLFAALTPERQRHVRFLLDELGADIGIERETYEVRDAFSGAVIFRAPKPGQ
jgi:uncharacterized alpha-E superfamily protein